MSTKINKRTPVHQGRVFNLFRENITLDNGVTLDMDVIRHPGASAIVPLINGTEVVLIKQYRHAIGNFIWEIPAGTLDLDEEPIECARRELTEETGFSTHTLEKLGEITPVPGYSDERIHIFLARNLEPARQNLDKDEVLNVHHLEFTDALEMIHKGEIQDGKTICGLLMAARRLKTRWF